MAAIRHTLRRLRAHAGQTAIVMLSLAAGVVAAGAAGVVCWYWFDARTELTFGVSAWSRAAWIVMALVPLVASAAVAAFIPARRILRTDLTLTMKASEQDA